MIKILRLQDPNDKNINHSSVIITDLKYYQLETEIKKIINEFEKEGFWDWSYENVLEELEKKGKIKVTSSEEIVIYC